MSSGEGEAVVLGGGGTGWLEGPVVALGGDRGCGEEVVVSVSATEAGIWPAGAATTRGAVGVVPMLATGAVGLVATIGAAAASEETAAALADGTDLVGRSTGLVLAGRAEPSSSATAPPTSRVAAAATRPAAHRGCRCGWHSRERSAAVDRDVCGCATTSRSARAKAAAEGYRCAGSLRNARATSIRMAAGTSCGNGAGSSDRCRSATSDGVSPVNGGRPLRQW